VNHFVISQLLSRSRRVVKKKKGPAKSEGDLGDGWGVGGLE
jgi:hypothetical protein